MRIIHTSDWHLGQHFYTKSRAAEHQAFLSWLIEQIQTNTVSALIVAGDIFDTGSPPSYARELYNRFVVDLQSTGCQLVILGGNHDSIATLNESRKLLACLNTRVIPGVMSDPDQHVLLLTNQQGEPEAIVCAIPYIRPRDVLLSQAGFSANEKQQALLEAITHYYDDIYQRALALRQQLSLPLPIIATGHLTALGASSSDSVREIYIGTLDAFPAQAFPPADYIALGHIHRAQTVAKSEHIRYSGSPIPLSFDEVGKEKSVCLVTFEGQALSNVTLLPVPEFQPMRLIKGDLAAIETELETLRNSDPAHPVWLDIEVASQEYLSDLQRHVQTLTDGLPVEVILLRRSKELRRQAIERQDKETLAELSVDDVFERRLIQEEMAPEQQQQLRGAFQHIIGELSDDASGDAE